MAQRKMDMRPFLSSKSCGLYPKPGELLLDENSHGITIGKRNAGQRIGDVRIIGLNPPFVGQVNTGSVGSSNGQCQGNVG